MPGILGPVFVEGLPKPVSLGPPKQVLAVKKDLIENSVGYNRQVIIPIGVKMFLILGLKVNLSYCPQ